MMRASPVFSVIIPTYQRSGPLRECLTALAQARLRREEYEVLVVDDGGSEALDDTVASFDGRMAVRLLRQENAGPAAARNTGAGQARGSFLAFTDDDCIPDPGWLSALAEPLLAGPNRMVGGRVRNALSANLYSSASQAVIDLVYAYYNAAPLHARFFAANNMALPADLFRALGGFAPGFRTSEDRDLCDRWLNAGYDLIYAPEAVVDHVRPLTFLGFWKQQEGYGRGAWRFHRAHGERRSTESTLEAGFYVDLVRRLPMVMDGLPAGRALALAGLLGIWQIANIVGFVSEAIGSPRPDRAIEGSMRHASR